MVWRKEHGAWHLSLTVLFPGCVFMGESFNLARPAPSPSSENGNSINMNSHLHKGPGEVNKCNYSFVQQVHVLSTHHVSDTVLGAGDTVIDKT